MHKDGSATAKPRVRAIAPSASEPTATPRDSATRKCEHAKLLNDDSRRYHAIVDTATDAIIVFSHLGQVQSFNPAAERIFGYLAAEVIGANIELLISEADLASPDGFLSAFRVSAKRKVVGSIAEVVGKRKDGSTVALELSIAAWRDLDRHPYFTGIMRDVTFRNTQARDLQEAIEAAHQARIEAESANLAKTEFLAVMSHEIRTPLTSISGFVDLLTRTDGLTQQQRRYIEVVKAADAALLAIVNDILDFSKVEAGQVQIECQTFSLLALIDDTLAIARVAAIAKSLLLEYSVDPGVPEWLMGDHARLRQVLLNLLNNAVKFTEAGSISVSVRKESATDGRERIRFSVTDTGIGIPAAQQHRLFKKFSQVDTSISRQHGGTGLGLAICKRLVELMDGEIGVVSEVGKGSTMWFTAHLPSATKPATMPAIKSNSEFAPEESAQSNVRILVVDDLDTNREILETYLEDIGYQVDTVGSGSEAIQALGSERYDLVLMDIQMPIMDGVTATKHIRAMPHPVKNIPIIAVSGNVLPQQVTSYLDAGMNDHIGKPIECAQLYSNIQRWLPKTKGLQVRIGPSSPNCDKRKFDEFVNVVGTEKAKRIATKFLGDLAEAFKFKCTLVEAQQEAHALINCAGVFGLQDFVTACRAIESVSPDDVDHGLAAVEEVRRERLAARQTLLDDLLPELRDMAFRPTENEASTMAAFARLRWPRLDAEARAVIGGPTL
jgi:PAS domain S-box-containing protein